MLDLLNHTEEDLSLAGSLIHTDTGRKKLRLQQNLLIHHSNGNLQVGDSVATKHYTLQNLI